MADPWHHAVSSSRKWGGEPEDYLAVHAWFDEPKDHFCDPRSRALRHHTLGIAWAIEHFGPTITLSVCARCGKGPLADPHMSDDREFKPHLFEAKQIPTRWIGEQHCLEDFGRIPTVADWLRCMTTEPWMVRGSVKLSRIL